jgi:hypothetical protein
VNFIRISRNFLNFFKYYNNVAYYKHYNR